LHKDYSVTSTGPAAGTGVIGVSFPKKEVSSCTLKKSWYDMEYLSVTHSIQDPLAIVWMLSSESRQAGDRKRLNTCLYRDLAWKDMHVTSGRRPKCRTWTIPLW
jgi:hypothetical protein